MQLTPADQIIHDASAGLRSLSAARTERDFATASLSLIDTTVPAVEATDPTLGQIVRAEMRRQIRERAMRLRKPHT